MDQDEARRKIMTHLLAERLLSMPLEELEEKIQQAKDEDAPPRAIELLITVLKRRRTFLEEIMH